MFFYIEPEVAGSLGPRTRMNSDAHPPIIYALHYEFSGWQGDVLLESFPAFLVTQSASHALSSAEFTGFELAEVEITKSEQFEDLYPSRQLPFFFWLRPTGKPGADDFGCAIDGRLVVSERTLRLLQTLGISHALIEPVNTN